MTLSPEEANFIEAVDALAKRCGIGINFKAFLNADQVRLERIGMDHEREPPVEIMSIVLEVEVIAFDLQGTATDIKVVRELDAPGGSDRG